MMADNFKRKDCVLKTSSIDRGESRGKARSTRTSFTAGEPWGAKVLHTDY